MADLSGGVDAGIGASGPAQADRPGVELGQPALDHFLHGKAIGLTLPADVIGAVIFDE